MTSRGLSTAGQGVLGAVITLMVLGAAAAGQARVSCGGPVKLIAAHIHSEVLIAGR
jgi:hypothetical protein